MGSVFFNEGENKKRPGVYQRQVNTGVTETTAARDGICAIPVQANWGPLGKVLKNLNAVDLNKNYGSGEYGSGNTVPAAAAMFDGGASVVYTYRLGTGGTKASKELTSGLTATAKYPGTMPIAVAVKAKIGDTTRKQLQIYANKALVEEFTFAADTKTEGANLIAAVKDSKYIDVAGAAATVPVLAVASGALTGGTNPNVTNANYSDAFAALEPYYYNTIALDVDDDESMSLSLLLQAYLADAYRLGKQGHFVVGAKTDVDFDTRLANASAFNDGKCVYLGGGWMNGSVSMDGVLGICATAGAIAATPSNQAITHAVIKGATDLCESLTYDQYEQAIDAGMLMVSMAPDGSIWYDSGITTLVAPETDTEDAGWKKIKRGKVRFEMKDRLDRALAPLVGRVPADTDGVANIIQTGQRELTQMVAEGKLRAGASFTEDPGNPYNGDSGWFIVQADDIDSMEKIYLTYHLRNSQNT